MIPDSPWGTKSVTLEANGRYFIRPFIIEGTYKIEGDQITFVEETGRNASCLGIPGTWKWKFDGKVLTLNLVQDECVARVIDYDDNVPLTLENP